MLLHTLNFQTIARLKAQFCLLLWYSLLSWTNQSKNCIWYVLHHGSCLYITTPTENRSHYLYRIVSYRGYWYYSNVTETEKKDGDDHATCIVSYRGYWYYSNVTETEKKDGDDHINSEFQVIIILKSSFNISEKEKEKKHVITVITVVT